MDEVLKQSEIVRVPRERSPTNKGDDLKRQEMATHGGYLQYYPMNPRDTLW
jgi:hypothetical protein